MTKLLEKQFTGIGEVRNFNFLQVYSNDLAYIYKVGDKDAYFEVFERKTTPVCINFKKRIYSETDFKEIYPKAKDFGIWAFTYDNYNEALKKLQNL